MKKSKNKKASNTLTKSKRSVISKKYASKLKDLLLQTIIAGI